MNSLSTHDTPRILNVLSGAPKDMDRYQATNYVLSEEEIKRATELIKPAVLLQFFLPGNPCIYYGDEIGMDFAKDIPSKEGGYIRTGARTPMQWSDAKNAGFTQADEPWFEINTNYTEINVESEINNPDSILNYYKKLLRFRKENDIVKYGDFKMLKTPAKLFAYIRKFENQKMLVVCSFSEKEMAFRAPDDFDINKAELVLSNYDDNKNIRNGFLTRPYETRVYLIK